MSELDVLLSFINEPLDSADGIFNRFATLPGAALFRGENPGERFLFVPGNRADAATLVAHADTVFTHSGAHEVVVEGDIIRSGDPAYGIGADDRAGCAMLWLLRDAGHHLLVCDYEESTHRDAQGSCVGARYLMREHGDIARRINASSFMFEFDRRLSGGTRKEHYTCYDMPVTQRFRDFIEHHTGFIDDDQKGCTDIKVLCTDVCGANLCVGYARAHTPQEFMRISAFQNTHRLMQDLLATSLPRFPLTQNN
ncbi:MAG: hypothetical protein M0R76_07395 [Proteobacteria bacterium]|nr:hypothetical protein [Pseudomonadota bacterium]